MTEMNDAPEVENEETPATPVDLAEELLARDNEITDLKDRLLRQAAET